MCWEFRGYGEEVEKTATWRLKKNFCIPTRQFTFPTSYCVMIIFSVSSTYHLISNKKQIKLTHTAQLQAFGQICTTNRRGFMTHFSAPMATGQGNYICSTGGRVFFTDWNYVLKVQDIISKQARLEKLLHRPIFFACIWTAFI